MKKLLFILLFPILAPSEDSRYITVDEYDVLRTYRDNPLVSISEGMREYKIHPGRWSLNIIKKRTKVVFNENGEIKGFCDH